MHLRHRLVIYLAAAFLIAAVPLLSFPSKVKAASVTLKWINFSTIELKHDFGGSYKEGGTSYKLNGENNQQGNYLLASRNDRWDRRDDYYFTPGGVEPDINTDGIFNKTGDCIPFIRVQVRANSFWPTNNSAQVMLKGDKSGTTQCDWKEFGNVSVDNYGNHEIFFNWVDKDQLEPVGLLPSKDGDIVKDDRGLAEYGLFRRESGTNNFFEPDSSRGCAAKITGAVKEGGAFSVWQQQGDKCNDGDYKPIGDIKFGNPAKFDTAPLTGQPSSGLINTPSDTDATCELAGGSPLSWILCPVINGGAALGDWVFETVIIPFLENVPISTDSDSDIYKIWSGFRILANIMLVGALITVVIGQAMGKE